MNKVDLIKALHDLENEYLSKGSFLSRLNALRDHLPDEDVDFLQQNATNDSATLKILALMRQLNAAEVEHLAHYALEVWRVGETHHETVALLLHRLMCLHPDSFPPIHTQMLEAGIDDPLILHGSILFRDAPLEVSETLVEKLATQIERYYLTLNMFVWGNDPFVEHQMNRWRKQPPVWWEPRYADWTLEAGWELTTDGHRRNLYFDTCYALVGTEGERTTEVWTPREDTCPWCKQSLENLLDLDLTDPRLAFLGLEGTRLRMPFCPWCHAFKTQYFEVDFTGCAHWSAYNDSEPPFQIEAYEPRPNSLSLASAPRSTYEALLLTYNLGVRASQVGGYPSWDDDRFVECPSCQQHMLFIGEVDWGDVVDYGGWSYAHLCPSCMLTAANYFNT